MKVLNIQYQTHIYKMLKAIKKRIVDTIEKLKPTKKAIEEIQPAQVVSAKETRLRIIAPPGLTAYTFKTIIVVARNAREARRMYEEQLRKQVKLAQSNDIVI